MYTESWVGSFTGQAGGQIAPESAPFSANRLERNGGSQVVLAALILWTVLRTYCADCPRRILLAWRICLGLCGPRLMSTQFKAGLCIPRRHGSLGSPSLGDEPRRLRFGCPLLLAVEG